MYAAYLHACTKWTPISTDSSGKRIDDKIHIHLLLDTSASVHNLTQGSVNVQPYTLCAYCMCSVDGTSPRIIPKPMHSFSLLHPFSMQVATLNAGNGPKDKDALSWSVSYGVSVS